MIDLLGSVATKKIGERLKKMKKKEFKKGFELTTSGGQKLGGWGVTNPFQVGGLPLLGCAIWGCASPQATPSRNHNWWPSQL